MRRLTFKGFLTKYVKELSYSKSVNLAVLADEAAKGNYRLRAPLVLYAVENNQEKRLQLYLEKYNDCNTMMHMLSRLAEKDIEKILAAGDLPEEYLKVWNSFQRRCDKQKNEAELVDAMRKKIIQLQKAKGLSNYRLYKDLGLNPGNINSWLKNGNRSKVSYQTASKIITYVMQY